MEGLAVYPRGLMAFWGLLESRDDAVVRALASHQSGPGLIPSRSHMWVEFVVGSCPCSEGFLQVLWFSSLHKNQHSKFQYDQIEDPHENLLRLMWLPL